MPHHQSVARQKSKLVADFGLMTHLMYTWARQLLDSREFVLVEVEGRHPSSDPNPNRVHHGQDGAV